MKRSKFFRVLAIMLSIILFNSAVTVSASAYDAPSASVAVQSEEADEGRIIVINGKECNVSTFGGIVKGLVNCRSVDDLMRILYTLGDHFITGLFGMLKSLYKEPAGFIAEKDYVTENFYEGTKGEFLDKPAENAVWKLGYAQKSLNPSDILTNKKYYSGGYIGAPKINPDKILQENGEVLDGMKVRVIALDAGNGTALFATIDAIGFSNADVRDIRQRLAEYAKANNIVSINVFATHCHSVIDTMGIWTNTFPTLFSHLFKNRAGLEMPDSAANQTVIKLIKTKTVEAMKEAYEDMEEGTLSFAAYDASKYVENVREFDQNAKDAEGREIAGTTDKMMERFVFTPEDENSEPTMIVNGNVHLNIASADTDKGNGDVFSSDYVVGMERVINDAGYNFMFFNGAIAAVKLKGHKTYGITTDGVKLSGLRESTHRWGYELGFHLIYIDRSEEDLVNDPDVIAKRDKWLPAADNYDGTGAGTPWYKDKVASEVVELDPILNIRHQELKIRVDSQLMKLVCKANVIHANVLKAEDGTYKYVTEIGYMEIGNKKIALVPGEIEPALVFGGKLLEAKHSYSGMDYKGSILKDVMEDENIMVFGLANDEIGYIIPDNDYCDLGLFGDVHHKEELLILHPELGSELIGEYKDLYNGVK